ncbi:DUF4254 domain-containing protein [Nocardia nova]|uniref:DUF4254 domain-containing protein n=1 Tax=Nocardia nova TaxID=37330 RepID=UPI0034032DEE
MIGNQLPSRELVLAACAGRVADGHPLLAAARGLAELYGEQLPRSSREMVCERMELARQIDQWVTTEVPRPHGAAPMHSETVGMVVDRIARCFVTAHGSLTAAVTPWDRHCAWRCLAEISLGYAICPMN